jgi:hypothetical protein
MKFIKIKYQSTWALIVGFGIGVLAAFPFAAPVIGSVIPESAATLWGSALGALIAVGGAFWVSDHSQRAIRRNAAAIVLEVVDATVSWLEDLSNAYGHPVAREDAAEHDDEPDILTPENWNSVRASVDAVFAEYGAMNKKMHRVEGVITMLGLEELRSYLALELELELAMSVAESIRKRASERGLHFYPGPASWSARSFLFESVRNLQPHLETLRMASR